MTLSAPASTRRRPPLARPREGRVLAGVAAGLAGHLGVPVAALRVVLALSAFAGGFGLIIYVWLWALTPASGAPGTNPDSTGMGTAAEPPNPIPPNPVPPSPVPPGSALPGGSASAGSNASPPSRRALVPAVRARRGDILLGLALLALGLTLLGGLLGWGVQPGVVLPLLVVGGGAVLAYSQLDEVERARWVERAGVGTRAAVLRVAGGLALVLLGILLVLLRTVDAATAGVMLISAAAVLGGAGLVLAPWAVRLWRDLDAERAARARQEERADIAAHLHDSVLQTLALIQRHSADQGAVSRLARAQERDLRDWLYGPRPNARATLAGEVRQAAAGIEDLHTVTVEVVMVGDHDVTEPVAALVAALREAIVNAARHAGGPVQVYVEAGPDGIEAFVRDRGPGFELAAVPPDRRGVRESIIGRMERHGGTAGVRSRPGEGTEIRLALPAVPGLSPAQWQGQERA